MNKLNQLLALAGITSALFLSAGSLMAQDQGGGRQRGGGNFDPAQFEERIMERYKEGLEFKSDDEWNAVKPLVQKVFTARRDVGFGGRGGFGRGRGGGGGNNQGGRRGFGGEPNPEVDALQQAIDSNAPSDEIKAKLAKVRESRKEKEAELQKAQDDLRKVLTVRQEAQAVLMGLLN